MKGQIISIEKFLSVCNPIAIKGQLPSHICTLQTDSRLVGKKDVFLAKKGKVNDGHNYINQALSQGASLVVGEYFPENIPSKGCMIQTESVDRILWSLIMLIYGHAIRSLELIGITGTNGKTSVVTWIYQLLTHFSFPTALFGTIEKNFNGRVEPTKLTTSDAIEIAHDLQKCANLGISHVVMEISSHALTQNRVGGLDFKAAVFTNISHDHLDYHHSLENYISAKSCLFSQIKKDGFAVVNADDSAHKQMVDAIREDQTAHFYTTLVDKKCDNHFWFCSCIKSSSLDLGTSFYMGNDLFKIPLVGSYNVMNVIQAMVVCQKITLRSMSEMKQPLSKLVPPKGRMEKVTFQGHISNHVYIDFAHTPVALEQLLHVFRKDKMPSQSLWVVFGCGGGRDKDKRPKMCSIALKYADNVIITSDNPRYESPENIIGNIIGNHTEDNRLMRILDRKEAITKVLSMAKKGDIVLIVGKGHELYQEINGNKIYFNDAEEIMDCLKNQNYLETLI